MATKDKKEAAPAAGAEESKGQFQILGQYVKDLSFENPKAPHSFVQQDQPQPEIGINVTVNGRKMGDNSFESTLQIQIQAKSGEDVVYAVDLAYAGLFGMQNIPEEAVKQLLLIECPRLLFPYARQIISDVTRDGGYIPLMLQPIDFVSLYKQQQALEQAKPPAKKAVN